MLSDEIREGTAKHHLLYFSSIPLDQLDEVEIPNKRRSSSVDAEISGVGTHATFLL